MAARTRRIVLALAAVLAIAAAAVFLWLPFDPLEGPAGPLDTLIPRDVDSAWRADGASFLRAPLARTLWDLPDAEELRARWNVEERLLEPMRRAEEALASASLGLADSPSIERDLMPAEVIVATRGDDVLLATRISSRARAIEFLRKLPAARAEELGIRVDGRWLVLDGDAERPLHATRYRDVLLVSTSAALAEGAVLAAESGTGALAGVPGWADALRIAQPAGSKIFGWIRSGPVAQRLAVREDADAAYGTGAAGDAPPWRAALADLLAANDAEPLRVELDLSGRDALGLTCTLRWRDGVPQSLVQLGTSLPSLSLAARARAHAVPGETMASGGVTAAAAAVLRLLLGSQPPERQSVFEEALAITGESPGTVAESLAAHFEDGVGFVVARVREADEVLHGDDAGAVHAIPATLVIFRLRGPGADRAVLDALRRRAETLFGQPLGDTVEVLADGARVHTLRRAGLAGEWELLRPAFAFRGDELLFSTHEGFLRRALAHRASGGEAVTGTSGRTLTFDAAAAPLRRWLDDQAWEFADRSTWRDWAAERRAIEAPDPPETNVAPAGRAASIDARIRELKRMRRERDIPEAADAWRRRWRWLGNLSDARVSVDVGADDVQVRARVTLAGAK